MDRKKFMKLAGAGMLAAGIPGKVFSKNAPIDHMEENKFTQDADPADEKFWKEYARKYYDVSGDYINLENGYYGIQPKPILAAYQKHITYVNREAIRFARKVFPERSKLIKEELAAFLGVPAEEIIITRNATEALNIAIQGYPFQTGDEVLISQLDYFSMIETFRMLEKRGTIKVKSFDMPVAPGSEDEIVEMYRSQITPATKLILLTHVSNINGLIIPVARISAMAKERGIDTITDSAHALGHIPFLLSGLGSDFVGLNLHKWIGNPIGAGVLYVRKQRIKDLKPLFGDVGFDDTDINKLAHFGTTPFAVVMTIPDSIAHHKLLGAEKISARLHYLKSIWVKALSHVDGVEILTPSDPKLSCAIASFRVAGKKQAAVADALLKKYGILTTQRNLGSEGCIRVTPALFNSREEIEKFIKGVKDLS